MIYRETSVQAVLSRPTANKVFIPFLSHFFKNSIQIYFNLSVVCVAI